MVSLIKRAHRKAKSSVNNIIGLQQIPYSRSGEIRVYELIMLKLKMSMKMILLLTALLTMSFLGIANVQAQSYYYVRAGATGAKNGSDWTNAYSSLPSTLVRGGTYYIAGGSYSGRTFNTAPAGTSVITIKGATIADHGTDSGWNNSYSVENMQATWTSNITFNTSHWVFDGSVGPLWSQTPSEYGFKFKIMVSPISIYNTSSAITDITISHLTATAPAGDLDKDFIITHNETKSINNVTISYVHGDGWVNFLWATSAGRIMDNWTVEYCVILNGYSSAAHHGEDLNNNYSYLNDFTVRYNWFEGRDSGTGCIVVLNDDAGPYYIYGNVLKDMRFGDGCITGVINGYGTQEMSGVVYNNTFINVESPYNYGGWIGTAVQSTVYNNLCYNMKADTRSNTTMDYNAYFAATDIPSEPNRQIGTGNPFRDLNDDDVSLTAGTKAGISLPSPYNVDAFGNIRGADGTWDRGAIEFGGNANYPPSPPQNFRQVSNR